MILHKKTVVDIEATFDYLTGIVSLAEDGDREDFDGAFDYARAMLKAAEKPMLKLEMYEAALQAFNEAEQLALADKFTEAIKLLQRSVFELREKSGSNDKLSKLYQKPSIH